MLAGVYKLFGVTLHVGGQITPIPVALLGIGLIGLRGWIPPRAILYTFVSLWAALAIFPVMALPLLLGGVTGAEFGRVLSVLLATLFLSLALGMFISTISRESRHASRPSPSRSLHPHTVNYGGPPRPAKPNTTSPARLRKVRRTPTVRAGPFGRMMVVRPSHAKSPSTNSLSEP